MKRKIYIAERIREGTPSVPINSLLTPLEIVALYTGMVDEHEEYIHNGHWMLRGPAVNGEFDLKRFPDTLRPDHIWEMCKMKIDDSDALVAVVGLEAYGAVAEAAYAIGQAKAVYILPEVESDELLKETWLLFYMSLSTEAAWREEDIQALDRFQTCNISSLADYKRFVQGIVPPFLK